MLLIPLILCYNKHGFIPWVSGYATWLEGALRLSFFYSQRQYTEQFKDNQADQNKVNSSNQQHLSLIHKLKKPRPFHIDPASESFSFIYSMWYSLYYFSFTAGFSVLILASSSLPPLNRYVAISFRPISPPNIIILWQPTISTSVFC